MIAPSVQQALDDFLKRWQNLAQISPVLALDKTWPSVGVVDHLTFFLRGRSRFSDEEVERVRGAAAYLCVMAQRCWESFGCEVTIDEGASGIEIRATGGEFLPAGRDHKVRVEEILKTILKNPPNPFPVIGDFKRPISAEQNLLSLFGIGLMTGLTPYGDGLWASKKPEDFTVNIDSATKILATQCAERYARLYHGETLGQVAELYLRRLIYPPFFMNEGLPARGAVDGIVNFAREYRMGPPQLLTLARNLALSPDDQISLSGLALYGALSEILPPPEILAVCEGNGKAMGLLRAAMLDVRKGLGLGSDWVLHEHFTEADVNQFRVETAMGFFPWVKLSEKTVRMKSADPRIAELIYSLAFFEFNDAVRIADEIISETPMNFEVRLQRIYLDMLNREIEPVIAALKGLLTEPGAEREPLLFNIWGMADLITGQNEEAARHFEMGYDLAVGSDHYLAAELANNLGWARIVIGKLDDALPAIEFAIRTSPSPVTALLNKAHIMQVTKKRDAYKDIMRELFMLSPLDRRLIGHLVLPAVS